MDGVNWDQGGTPPGGSNADRLVIRKDQDGPITLSKDLDLSAQGDHRFAFSGELKFDTAVTTLTLQRLFFQGDNKTTTLARGTLNVPTLYFEENVSGCHDNTFFVDGVDAKYVGGEVNVGSKNRNNSFIARNGAAVRISKLSVGRDAILNDDGTVASNNLFRVTGSGTTLTSTDTIATGVRHGNWIEILDGAQAKVPDVKLGVWQNDNAEPETPHLCDGDRGMRIAGAGTKVVVDGACDFNRRVTVGWQSGSNTLEIADGAELLCVTNKFIVGNYVSPVEGTAAVVERIPGYRFAGNTVRVTGAGAKVTLDSARSQFGFFMAQGGCDSQRLDVLDGASWESRGEFWIVGGVSNGVHVGENAHFRHSVYAVQIGVGGDSTNAYFKVDGGTYAADAGTCLGQGGSYGTFDVVNGGVFSATNGNLVIGGDGAYNVLTIGAGGRLATSNVALRVSNGPGEGNVFAVKAGGKARFRLDGDKHLVSANYTSRGGAILVSGEGSELDMSRDTLVAVPVAGGRGARLVVEDGGLLRVNDVYWGDQGNSENDCAVVVSDGAIEVAGHLSIGGSDDAVAHGCALTVAGARPSITGNGVGINRDSTIAFDVPAEGYGDVPIRVKRFSFGTRCTTARPTLRVTMSPQNRVRLVTLVEAEDDISIPDDLRLDLPAGARLVREGDYGYDPKRIKVRLPRFGGALLIIR